MEATHSLNTFNGCIQLINPPTPSQKGKRIGRVPRGDVAVASSLFCFSIIASSSRFLCAIIAIIIIVLSSFLMDAKCDVRTWWKCWGCFGNGLPVVMPGCVVASSLLLLRYHDHIFIVPLKHHQHHHCHPHHYHRHRHHHHFNHHRHHVSSMEFTCGVSPPRAWPPVVFRPAMNTTSLR